MKPNQGPRTTEAVQGMGHLDANATEMEKAAAPGHVKYVRGMGWMAYAYWHAYDIWHGR